jgi:hypothetical protein
VFCIPWIFGEYGTSAKTVAKVSAQIPAKHPVFLVHFSGISNPCPVKVESEANLDGMRKKIHLGDELQGYFLPCNSWKPLYLRFKGLSGVKAYQPIGQTANDQPQGEKQGKNSNPADHPPETF